MCAKVTAAASMASSLVANRAIRHHPGSRSCGHLRLGHELFDGAVQGGRDGNEGGGRRAADAAFEGRDLRCGYLAQFGEAGLAQSCGHPLATENCLVVRDAAPVSRDGFALHVMQVITGFPWLASTCRHESAGKYWFAGIPT